MTFRRERERGGEGQARKTFKIAWDPEFSRKIAFEFFLIKPTPITLINQFLCRKGPLKKKNTIYVCIFILDKAN